ncbi:MAG TPA: diacylglycerol kinase family protein [Solirubrobacteraceae bacterium]|nr:diacylglycerol kinase family protein [Solirubrobacteraceae bacterium]
MSAGGDTRAVDGLGPAGMTVRRGWSAAALALIIVALALAIAVAVSRFPRGLAVLACTMLAVLAAWYGIRRRGSARVMGLGAAGVLLAGTVVLLIAEGYLVEDLLVLALAAGALSATRRALRVHADLPEAPRPDRPVLFYNPRSGGGKAQRFHLVNEARRRGIDSVELRPGDDLETLVRDAVNRGADALAMAGGDGSQAIVAMIAAELDLPYACIPAGTRNHFALDLGVDRDDVVGALDAFVDGGERRVDLAEVNGLVFVNNVSLGLYADAVQRPEYRDAKLHTLLDTVPDVLGPDVGLPDLNCSGPAGRECAVAILVSNNAYLLGRAIGSGTRPRLDRGELGVAVLAPATSNGDGRVSRKLGKQQWRTPVFEIDAGSAVAAGIDGEATHLDPPLRFRILPAALRVRIARQHPGASPSALEPDTPWRMIELLATSAFKGGSAPSAKAR